MSEAPEKPKSKVVSLFSRQSLEPEHVEAIAEASASVVAKPTGPVADERSVETLNSVIEEVLQGKTSCVCVIATGEKGLGRFFISFPKGSNPQLEAQRYLGQLHVFGNILEEIVYDGIATEAEDGK